MFGRAEVSASLPLRKLRPATAELPSDASYQLSRWEKGTMNFEAVAGQMAAIDYLAELGVRFGQVSGSSCRRERLDAGFRAIAAHENMLSAQFVDGIEALSATISIYGPPTVFPDADGCVCFLIIANIVSTFYVLCNA